MVEASDSAHREFPPGETLRVLKDKDRDEKAYGEYRTRRLVLEAWERQGEAFSRRVDA